MFTKDHLKAILAGEKRLLLVKDIKVVNMPKYDELSVKAIYDPMMMREDLRAYFPDHYPAGRQCAREYFWCVCDTVYPKEIDAMIKHANVQRCNQQNPDDCDNKIKVTDEWAKILEAHPFKLPKKGG
jgi:hypothetical protein